MRLDIFIDIDTMIFVTVDNILILIITIILNLPIIMILSNLSFHSLHSMCVVMLKIGCNQVIYMVKLYLCMTTLRHILVISNLNQV